MASILEICQEAADLATVQRPDNLFDVSSQHNATFLSVAKDTLDSLMRYGDWQDLTKEATIRTVASRTVYPIGEVVPDFYCILNNTVYIKDSSEKVIGAITPEQWMRDRYFCCPSVDVKFKIQNNAIKFLSAPPCGVQIVFQYRSNAICVDAKSFEEKSKLTKNTDIPIFDEYLVKLGIVWRWYRRNGMAYEEEYNDYMRELHKKFGTGLATGDIVLGRSPINLADVGVIVNVKEC